MATGSNVNPEDPDSGYCDDRGTTTKDKKLDSTTASCFDPSLNKMIVQHFALVDGSNKLMLAIASNEPAETLIDNAPTASDLNLKNECGQTAMIIAALHKQHNYIRRLLLAGADPNVKDASGKTALHYSVLNEDLDSLKALTAEVTGAEKDAYYKPCSFRSVDETKVDVNIQDNEEKTPLHLAVQLQNAAMVKTLILAGADVNTLLSEDLQLNGVLTSGYDCLSHLMDAKLGRSLDKTSNVDFGCFKDGTANVVRALGGMTISEDANEQQPATTSSSSHSHQATQKPEKSDIDNVESGVCVAASQVKDVIQNRYSVHFNAFDKYYEIDSDDSSDFMKALAKGDDFAEFLIDNAPDVSYLDGCNYQRVSPIHVAARFGNCLAVRRLRFAGADPNLRDMDGNTAVHHAIIRGDTKTLSELLVDANSDSFFRKCPHRKAELKKVDVNIRNYEDETPLLLAVKLENLDIVKQLVNHGADPNIALRSVGYTPLHLAAERGNEAIVKVLVAQCNSIRFNQRSSAGYTALDVAKSRVKRNEEITKFLESLDSELMDEDD